MGADYREVPTCPACRKRYTLILVDGGIRCTRDAGGCGGFYSADKLPRLYEREPSSLPVSVRKPDPRR
jgi:hypothetical protein